MNALQVVDNLSKEQATKTLPSSGEKKSKVLGYRPPTPVIGIIITSCLPQQASVAWAWGQILIRFSTNASLVRRTNALLGRSGTHTRVSSI